MIHIVWEFRIRTAKRRIFERLYGSAGRWAMLFRRSRAYKGTLLLRDPDRANRYLLVDRWTDWAAFRRFKRRFRKEYETLDRECWEFTRRERRLGCFEPV